MCCCGKPTRNGEPGYSWDGKTFSVRPLDPPALDEGDILLWDEPGRCGDTDSHCHHFRIVKPQGGGLNLLIQNGTGRHRHRLAAAVPLKKILATLDSDGRYWLMCALSHAVDYERVKTRKEVNARWHQAAAEKKIRTRKQRGSNTVKVWIEGTV